MIILMIRPFKLTEMETVKIQNIKCDSYNVNTDYYVLQYYIA